MQEYQKPELHVTALPAAQVLNGSNDVEMDMGD